MVRALWLLLSLSLFLAFVGASPGLRKRREQRRRALTASSIVSSFALVPHKAKFPDDIASFHRDTRGGSRRRRRQRRRRLQDRPVPEDYDETQEIPATPAAKDDGDTDQDTDDTEDAADEVETDVLYQGYGTHYVDLWVGTPPQRQTVIVDTGSSVTAFPCMDCVNCGDSYHVDSYYQEEQSGTFIDVPCEECFLGQCLAATPLCEVSVSYQEGSSWRAYEVEDVVHAGGNGKEEEQNMEDLTKLDKHQSFRMHFGCQIHLTGLFKTQLADGIMGMEMARSSFWKQMHSQVEDESSTPQAFSLCFTHESTASKEGNPAGIMNLGGTNPQLMHKTPMVFAQQMNKDGWFAVKLQAVYLRTNGGLSVEVGKGDALLPDDEDQDYDFEGDPEYTRVDVSSSNLNNGQIIVDSGTTDTYLNAHMATAFKKAWLEVTGRTYDHEPWELTEEELLELPTVVFQLKGVQEDNEEDPTAPGLAASVDTKNPFDVLVAMPPTHYMEYSLEEKTFKSRVYLNEIHGGVLGANFMLGHDILFDVDNQRLGFAESDCNYRRISEEILAQEEAKRRS